MGVYVSAEIEAEAVIDAMNENGEFLSEMWTLLAERLHMGLLLDNSCDVLCDQPNQARQIANQMRGFAQSLEDGIQMRGGDL